ATQGWTVRRVNPAFSSVFAVVRSRDRGVEFDSRCRLQESAHIGRAQPARSEGQSGAMKTTHFLAGLAVLASIASVGRAQVAMNEIYASMAGTDTSEYYELIGTPGTSLTGYMLLVVAGDF